MSERSAESSCQVIVITHLVLVFDIFSVLPGIEFEGHMTESRLHCVIKFRPVLWCHDEAFVIVVIIDRLLLELGHAADELLHAIRSMDYAIRFVECGEVTLDFVSHSAWSVLLV